MKNLEYQDKMITVLTGAGISKASGIPTFRGEDGLWKNYNVEELATPFAFAKQPKIVWEWYKWRIGLILNAEPNPAHEILAKLERQGFKIVIITQNVDDLHDRVSNKVLHVHGEIRRAICTECENELIWTLELLNKEDEIPCCKICGNYYRPAVVWFGEQLDNEVITKCLDQLLTTDILIIAGTSGVVYPVAEFPFFALRNNPDISIIEFNIERTPISRMATETIIGPVEETLVDYFKDII